MGEPLLQELQVEDLTEQMVETSWYSRILVEAQSFQLHRSRTTLLRCSTRSCTSSEVMTARKTIAT